MNKIYTIYSITNKINNKKYIGFTGKTIQCRLGEHLAAAKVREKSKGRLYAAIRKYGKENFYIDAICCSKDRIYTLHELEPYFIQKYNTIESGYNINLGGPGLSYHTDETKKILSELAKKRKETGWISPSKGKKRSKEICNKMSLGIKRAWSEGKFNSAWTEERRIKQSQLFTGNKNPFYGKKHKRESIANRPKRTQESIDAHSKKWEITTPEKDVIQIINLNKFCKEKGISPGTLRLVSIGLRTHHKGYKCRQIQQK